MIVIEELKKFFKDNNGTHYMIKDKDGCMLILKIINHGFEAVNTKEIIEKNFGDILDYSYAGFDRFEFTIRSNPNVSYYLFNYDWGIVSI
ncbi:hypothetical protein D3C74_339980 [compost metagenome]